MVTMFLSVWWNAYEMKKKKDSHIHREKIGRMHVEESVLSLKNVV